MCILYARGLVPVLAFPAHVNYEDRKVWQRWPIAIREQTRHANKMITKLSIRRYFAELKKYNDKIQRQSIKHIWMQVSISSCAVLICFKHFWSWGHTLSALLIVWKKSSSSSLLPSATSGSSTSHNHQHRRHHCHPLHPCLTPSSSLSSSSLQ